MSNTVVRFVTFAYTFVCEICKKCIEEKKPAKLISNCISFVREIFPFSAEILTEFKTKTTLPE